MAIDKDELKRLSPGERLKRLKQMEEDRKKEVREIEGLIKDSMRELKTDRIAEEVTPEQKPVDISRLFEAEGGELERAARREAPMGASAKGPSYQALMQAYEAYSDARKLAAYASAGSLSEDKLKAAVDDLGERIDKTKYQTPSAEVAKLVVATQSVLSKIRRYAGLE